MYGGGGCSTLIADWCASIRERPGSGDDGADEFGGVGNGESERFCGIDDCEDDACGWSVLSDCEPDGCDSSEESTVPTLPARWMTSGGVGLNEGAYEGGGDASGSSGLVTERMRRCEDASAALRSAADMLELWAWAAVWLPLPCALLPIWL